MTTWRILCGDVRERLAEIPDGSVQCCVTSPPYWGLRDYGHSGQIGLERTPEAYVSSLQAVFADVRRVLMEDATVWLNLGDTYAGNRSYQVPDNKRKDVGNSRGMTASRRRDNAPVPRADMVVVGTAAKNLVGIPWRVAFALQADGWYLRSAIIWHKPNPMPESVTDRPTSAYEHLFLLAKSERYYYNADAIKEPYSEDGRRWWTETRTEPGNPDRNDGGGVQTRPPRERQDFGTTKRAAMDPQGRYMDAVGCAGYGDFSGRNKRNVWTVPTQPYPEAHFATYPEKLIEPCILAGSREGDLVIDPFTGSGTTGAVAVRLQRSFVGVELNPAYVELARKRIGDVAPLLAQEVA